MQLVPRDAVLPEHGVRITEQDEDRFDTGGDSLLKLDDVGDIEVDVVIDIYPLWGRSRDSRGVFDARVEIVAEGAGESWLVLPV